jgi:hypothetical protein
LSPARACFNRACNSILQQTIQVEPVRPSKCARGLDALKLYRADYDDKLQTLRPHPVHDWTSHAADSFRYLAMTLDGQAGTAEFHRRIEYPRHLLA